MNLSRHVRGSKIDVPLSRTVSDHLMPDLQNSVFISYRRKPASYVARAIFQDLKNLVYSFFLEHSSQSNSLGLVNRNHDLHLIFEQSNFKKFMLQTLSEAVLYLRGLHMQEIEPESEHWQKKSAYEIYSLRTYLYIFIHLSHLNLCRWQNSKT